MVVGAHTGRFFKSQLALAQSEANALGTAIASTKTKLRDNAVMNLNMEPCSIRFEVYQLLIARVAPMQCWPVAPNCRS